MDIAVQPAGLDTSDLPPRVRRIAQSLLRPLLTECDDVLARTLGALQHGMEADAGRAADACAHEEAMLANHSLQVARTRMPARLALELEAQLAALRSGPRAQAPAEQSSLQGMQLLTEHVVDDAADLREIAGRLAMRTHLPLYLMGQRMGVLAASPALEAAQLPLGPQRLCDALRAAAIACGLQPGVRARLFRQMEPQLLARYPACVDAMNAILVEAGVLPHLTHVPVRGRNDRQVRDPGLRPHEPAAQPPPAAAQEPTPTPDRSTLRSQLAHRRAMQGRATAAQPERQRHRLQAADVQRALARQRTVPHPPASVHDARLAILADERQRHGQGVALDDAQADVLDLLDLYYLQLARLLRPDAAASAHARRLMLPLIEHALADVDGFFNDPGNPARRLLEAVLQGGGLHDPGDDEDPQLQAAIAEAVDAVVASSGDPQAFARALQQLEARLQPLARRADIAGHRLVDAARGREKLALARRDAGRALHARIDGRALPEWQTCLLEHSWLDAMTMTLLRHGPDSLPWQDLLHATARIVNGQPLPGEDDDAPAAAVLQALQQLGHHDTEAAQIAGCLLHPQESHCRALHERLRDAARLGDHGACMATESPAPRHPAVAGLRAGDWVLLPAQGRSIARCLAWRGDASGGLLFVGRRGQRLDNAPADLATLGELVASGQARLLQEAPLSPALQAWEATRAALAQTAAQELP